MIAGIDLGGTQVRVALAGSEGGLLRSARTRTELLGTPQALAGWVAAQTRRLGGPERLRAVAIGAPGPVDQRRGVLVNPPNLPWRNVFITDLLSEALGCPAYLENDANLAGLGEFHQGAGRGSRTMVYITWSTGVGGGLILDGQLFRGAHGAAGEIGHLILDPHGPLDRCGQRGCVEAICGGSALFRETGEPAAELFQAAARGDADAVRVVARVAGSMGGVLVSLTNLIDPELIVMGGGVTGSWSLIRPALLGALRASPFIRAARRPRLRRAQLGDRAGQVGAVEWARANS